MNYLLVCVFILFSVLPLNAQRATLIRELAQPRMIAVDGSQLYVADRYSIFIYSLKNYKLVKQFGRQGEGPGEFRTKPHFQVLDNELLIASSVKISYFSKSGELIREKRLPGILKPVEQVGKSFVAKKWDFKIKDENIIVMVRLYDEQFQDIKGLLKSTPVKMFDANKSVKLVAPKVKFICTIDRIYLTTEEECFCIKIYNERGEYISNIKRDYQRVKVTGQHKQKLKEAFWAIPTVRRRIAYHKKREYIFPEYFHAINDFHIADKTLYVKTFEIRNGEEEYILLDLNGKYLRKVYLPEASRDYFAFKNNRFYFIKENEDGEGWEFREVDLKN